MKSQTEAPKKTVLVYRRKTIKAKEAEMPTTAWDQKGSLWSRTRLWGLSFPGAETCFAPGVPNEA